MNLSRRKLLTLAASAGLLSGWRPALAEDVSSFPSKPITIVVPYAPGGVATTFIRLQADLLEPILGQSILVENIPGGGGLVAAEKVGRSEPDGYTWLSVQSGLMTITPNVTTGFNPAEGLQLMATSRAQPMMLVVRNDSPYKSVQDILDDARKRPGAVSYASLGINSLHHIIGETISDITGLKLLHVPYTGGAQYMVDLLAGRVDFAMSTAGSMAGFPGQVRALALAQVEKSLLSEGIPTSAEAGLLELDLPSWVGLAVPKGTPKPIIDKINVALKQVDEDPKFRAEMHKLGAEPYFVTGDQFEPKLQAHREKIGVLLKKLNAAAK